jgi:predicted MFS family arabinose efflux permease
VVEADLGIIFTINGLASIVGAMPSGYLIDKMPGHLVLAAALALEVGVWWCWRDLELCAHQQQ